jgi:hypothetical protein
MSLKHFIGKTGKTQNFMLISKPLTKNAKKLRNFMYIQPKMLDPDPDSMNPDPKHCQYLPILESFSNSVCLFRMTGSSSPRSSVMFTMTVFSLLACAPMSRPYSDMESSLPGHRIPVSLLKIFVNPDPTFQFITDTEERLSKFLNKCKL